MQSSITICVREGGDIALAQSFSQKYKLPLSEALGQELSILFDVDGISLSGFGLSYRGDFEESMLRRVTNGRLTHEMLVKAAKSDKPTPYAVDATAGMGEDSFLLAAYGYEVTLFEQNPVIALLLKDAIRRAKKHPLLGQIASRMHLMEEDSIPYLRQMATQGAQSPSIDVIYLDPMFPQRKKSGLINKKLQLIQKLEPPCCEETDLFNAALAAAPAKIIVKRPLKSPHLAERTPSYILGGKAIRYDCYLPASMKH